MTNEDLLERLPPLTFEDFRVQHQERYGDILGYNCEQRPVDKEGKSTRWEHKTYGFTDHPAFVVSIKYRPGKGWHRLYIQAETSFCGSLSMVFVGKVETLAELDTIMKCSVVGTRTIKERYYE